MAGLGIGLLTSFLYRQRKVASLSPGKMRVFSSISKKTSRKRVTEPLKIVLAVRQDLKMGKGKVAAQCCHAAVACVQSSDEYYLREWENRGAAKIALKAPDEDTIQNVANAARRAGLNYYVVRDAGRTQIAAGSITVCGIGPAPVSEIDKITGRSGTIPLKLL